MRLISYMYIMMIFSDKISTKFQKEIINNKNNVDNSIKITERSNLRNLENANYISVYFKENRKYDAFFTMYRIASLTDYLIYNQERKGLYDDINN